jgi:hypothetical protein
MGRNLAVFGLYFELCPSFATFRQHPSGDLVGAGQSVEAAVDQGQLLFYERLRRLGQKHRALARGYRARMRSDGLIVLVPKRTFVALSPRPLAIVLVIFVLVKGALMAGLGVQNYEGRVSHLQTGTALDRAGAAVMQPDPVSRVVALTLDTFRHR